jgi:hypothetical protein
VTTHSREIAGIVDITKIEKFAPNWVFFNFAFLVLLVKFARRVEAFRSK